MNYYNYFTEIEEEFVRRRGKHLLLSPIDWAMMETWQERGIPLHIVLRSIGSVFDAYDKNPGPRTIKGLMYCREEVEAQYAEWMTSQAGKSETVNEAAEGGKGRSDAAGEHIGRLIETLSAIENEMLSDEIERSLARLGELRTDAGGDQGHIDAALQDIEKIFEAALLTKTDKLHLKEQEKEVSAMLRQYKKDMQPEEYSATFRLMLLKRLREDAGIPRMTLLYL